MANVYLGKHQILILYVQMVTYRCEMLMARSNIILSLPLSMHVKQKEKLRRSSNLKIEIDAEKLKETKMTDGLA